MGFICSKPNHCFKQMSKTKTTHYEGPGSQQKVSEGYLLGVGNPLLDLVVDADQDFLDKYVEKKDQKLPILANESQKPMYEEIMSKFSDNVQFIAGGATQNSIRVANWLMNSEKSCSFIGSVGEDQYAEILEKACKEEGVAPYYYKTKEDSTGLCAVLVTNKERTLVTDLSAANLYNFEHTNKQEIQEVIQKASVFYISSFFLTPDENIKTCENIAKNAADGNKLFCMNLSAPFIMQVPPFFERVQKLIPFMDYVFGNETEAQALIDAFGWKCSLQEAALKLSSIEKVNGSRGRIVVFTQGKHPTIVASDGEITVFDVPPLDQELLVDTNGAGDAFVGGFLAKLCQGFDLAECVRVAHYAARVVIQQSGCTFPPQPDI
eukprot:maker-scaffold_17-snap-gene-3.34-mRNA-1 protein AED:0.02 eAED:0.02 QI:58/1/1/1/1/1/3/58/377